MWCCLLLAALKLVGGWFETTSRQRSRLLVDYYEDSVRQLHEVATNVRQIQRMSR